MPDDLTDVDRLEICRRRPSKVKILLDDAVQSLQLAPDDLQPTRKPFVGWGREPREVFLQKLHVDVQ
jgi:hypothetical protein